MTDDYLIDHFHRAHVAAEQHIEECWNAHNEEEAPEPTLALDDPFCGCLTCEVREILRAAEPHLRKAWEVEQGE